MIETSDTNQHILVTIANLGQPPRESRKITQSQIKIESDPIIIIGNAAGGPFGDTEDLLFQQLS